MALGLGVETTCDETSLAIVRDGSEILSLQLYSQTKEHAPFRGVVPELAAREHLIRINPLANEVFSKAKVEPQEIDFVAVSAYPGLVGSILIGSQFAKSFSLCFKKPIIPVDHLEAHLAVPSLQGETIPYPFLGILLSGGNSSIFRLAGLGNLEKISDTLDDALGEAFDKVGNLLNLPYPSAPKVEKLAETAQKRDKLLPILLKDAPSESLDFSFSGIKTAVQSLLKKNPSVDIPNLCYSFQESCFELVKRNLKKAVHITGIRSIVGGGGVFANQSLQFEIKALAESEGWKVSMPKRKILSTDNAAMVCALGEKYFQAKRFGRLDFAVSPRHEGAYV